MGLFYNILLGIYWFGVFIVSPLNAKARKFLKGRTGLFSKIKNDIPKGVDLIWFHAASLGEFEQGRPVIEALRKQKPDIKILLTFFSPSGYEIRKDYKGADYIYYLPLDLSWNAKRFIKLINPKTVYFIKYEFWFNYMRVLHNLNIPVYCFSANFRPGQAFFKWYGFWYRGILHKFTHFYVQNQQSKILLQEKVGIKNVTVCGDTRFDRVAQIAENTKPLPIVERFKNGKSIVIAGSTWPADEDILIRYINSSEADFKFIIAPHEIHESNILLLISQIKRNVSRYSQIEADTTIESDVLIIDNIGILSMVYQYGNIAYIGGGFGKGIHNILEAATFGLPVIFGPKYQKFHEAVELINRGGATAVHNYSSLKIAADKLLNDPVSFQKASLACKALIQESKGATESILKTSLQ
jgi:3-deoxy-D-manno-octulosonic-acid transferase